MANWKYCQGFAPDGSSFSNSFLENESIIEENSKKKTKILVDYSKTDTSHSQNKTKGKGNQNLLLGWQIEETRDYREKIENEGYKH